LYSGCSMRVFRSEPMGKGSFRQRASIIGDERVACGGQNQGRTLSDQARGSTGWKVNEPSDFSRAARVGYFPGTQQCPGNCFAFPPLNQSAQLLSRTEKTQTQIITRTWCVLLARAKVLPVSRIHRS
jgi:hypothetical protein